MYRKQLKQHCKVRGTQLKVSGFFIIREEKMYGKAFWHGKWRTAGSAGGCSTVRSFGSPGRSVRSGPGARLLPAGPGPKALLGHRAALADAQRPLRFPSSIGALLLCSRSPGAPAWVWSIQCLSCRAACGEGWVGAEWRVWHQTVTAGRGTGPLTTGTEPRVPDRSLCWHLNTALGCTPCTF